MAKKFFSTKEVKKPLSPCEQCKLCTVCISPKLRPVGQGKLGIAVVIDKPLSSMDKGESLDSGPEYTFLKNTFDKIGVDLAEDCWLVPVVACRTPKDRSPTAKEVKFCKERFTRFMEAKKPNVVIMMGDASFDSIIGPRIRGRLTGTDTNKFYGDVIPDQELGKWLMCTWSVEELFATKTYADSGYTSKPLYMRDAAVYRLFREHLYEACSKWDKKVEIVDYKQYCKTTTDIDVAIDYLSEACDWDYVSFDYETSGLHGYDDRHFVACMSISNGKVSYCFPNFDDNTFRKMWKRFLMSHTKKISHNLQFENLWGKLKFGTWTNGWHHDTMLGAHELNNWKATSLKFCTYTKLGVLGYDAEIDKFLKSSEADEKLYGCNAFNRIKEAPQEELLLYCAMDSLFTAILYEQQMKTLTPFQMEGNVLLVETAQTLSKMSFNGFKVREEDFEKVNDKLQGLLVEKRAEIMAMEEVSKWDGEEPFDFNSPKQLGHLLYDILKITPLKKTKTGYSVDKEVLAKYNFPFVMKIIKYRELDKMCSTYIDGWRREAIYGFVHPDYMLNTVDTFRSSSKAPNAQNNYKRDPEKKKITRSIIAPRDGHKIVEFDLHSAETYFNMFHSNDPKFHHYLSVKGSDMHKDFAVWLFLMEKENITKELRGAVKGDGTFAELYGSYYKLIAPNLWEFICDHPEVKAHLASKGITTYAQYEKVVEKAEKSFWGKDMFYAHDMWRKAMYEKYQKEGILKTLTGFILSAPMSRNNSFNGAPQGDAAHALFWIINQLQKKAEELNWKSVLIGEIHDSHIWSVHPSEEAELDYWTWYYTSVAIQEYWQWISLPLVVEKEVSDIDGTWANMHDCGVLDGQLAKPKEKG